MILPRQEERFALGDRESTGSTHFAPGWHLRVVGLSLRLLSLLSPQSMVTAGGPPGFVAEGPVGQHIPETVCFYMTTLGNPEIVHGQTLLHVRFKRQATQLW